MFAAHFFLKMHAFTFIFNTPQLQADELIFQRALVKPDLFQAEIF